jgi:hypothetical protein
LTGMAAKRKCPPSLGTIQTSHRVAAVMTCSSTH